MWFQVAIFGWKPKEEIYETKNVSPQGENNITWFSMPEFVEKWGIHLLKCTGI